MQVFSLVLSPSWHVYSVAFAYQTCWTLSWLRKGPDRAGVFFVLGWVDGGEGGRNPSISTITLSQEFVGPRGEEKEKELAHTEHCTVPGSFGERKRELAHTKHGTVTGGFGERERASLYQTLHCHWRFLGERERPSPYRTLHWHWRFQRERRSYPISKCCTVPLGFGEKEMAHPSQMLSCHWRFWGERKS